MKKLKGWMACAAVLTTASAMATPISGNSLQNTITAMGGMVDVQNEQYTRDQEWRVGAVGLSAARIQFELSAYASLNSFGIYDIYNPGSRLTIFSGSHSAGALGFIFNPSVGSYCTATFATIFTPTCASFDSDQFGFFLSTPAGSTFFSEKHLNADGVDHMVAFEGGLTRGSLGGNPWLANEYLLAWEDLYGGGDRDYDDFVVLVESVIGVPEPAAIALFGIGLFAVGVITRRRKALSLVRRS